MKKIIIIILILFPLFAFAEDSDRIFQARVLDVKESDTGQHLRLVGLNGDFVGQEFEFMPINSLEVINTQEYKKGDKVLAAASYSLEGEPNFYVIDYVRTSQIWLLVIFFVLVLTIVGRIKGLRSLLALGLTFLVIIKYLVPQILGGGSPIVVTLISSFIILLIIIYLTEGFKPISHLAIASIGFSLILTIIISQIFISAARLTGAASEDVLFLFDLRGATINLSGLLLAGIIIGALGVLDDVVISQVATVKEIKETVPAMGFKELYKKAYNVGVSHIASMTNTLFLAYAGVSLPLLILFATGNSALNSFTEAINTELIATEIVRTLSGSIGLILAVPIATFISARYYSRK